MNILIVGNGFDLSHYLPTKYDHFMDVMGAIESHAGETMSFDELFSKCREDWFIAKTKEYYLTGNIVLEKKLFTKIRTLLKENGWYHYFIDHVKEINTWIDFEKEIEVVLKTLSNFISEIENINDLENLFQCFDNENNIGLKIRKKDQDILSYFNIFSDEFYEAEQLNNLYPKSGYAKNIGKKRKNINPIYCYGGKLDYGLNYPLFLDFLMKELDDFIELFNCYLNLIVGKLDLKFKPRINGNMWVEPNKLYSFNYTNTYQRIYNSVEVDYLHGSHGEFQNIVLGVSDLLNDNLKELKAYGFTKYHQKLFKDTDYQFLDNYINTIHSMKFNADKNLKLMAANAFNDIRSKMMKQILVKDEILLDLTFHIWGHSLDISDKYYITDLFSLNDDIDRNVRVIIYFFDKNSKFSLLNNLLVILGKDKVEKWMKNKWLTFEPNPKIDFGIQEESKLEEQAS